MQNLWRATFVLVMFSFASGKWVKEMENDGLFGGDMVLSPAQWIQAEHGSLGYASTKNNHWSTTIYYDWDHVLANKKVIKDAIAEYEKYTCLRFKHSYSSKDKMYFTVGSGGCNSGVGYERGKGKHYISLSKGCWSKATVIHEMAHRLGIYHEQSRPDRDDYIEVKWENIGETRKFNFKKQAASNIDSFDTKYDYLSIMHYGQYTFSKNKKPTMITKDSSMQGKIGQKTGLSEIDKLQINKMHHCNIDPAYRPYVFQHSGGNCFSISQDTLILHSRCNNKFILSKQGELQLVGTSKCAYADGTTDNSLIKFKENCGQTFEKVYVSGEYFALKNVQTGKCLQPEHYSGKSYSRLFIKSGCIFQKYRMI